jgi:hypothetical protein
MGKYKLLWAKAERENRLKLSHSDFMLIIVSSAVSGVVSFLLSHVNSSQLHITGNSLVDITIYALFMAVLVAIVISLLFRLLSFFSRALNFVGLLFKYRDYSKVSH